MYNEDRKQAYIDGSNYSVKQKEFLKKIFTKSEPYEVSASKDVSEMDIAELKTVIDRVGGMRVNSWGNTVSALRTYVKWCVASGYPGSHEIFDQVIVSGVDALRKRMVASPAYLESVLDDTFSPVPERKVDLIFRGFLWLAFSGMEEEDTFDVTAEDLDFITMKIRYNGRTYPIYAEAVQTLHYLAECDTFVHSHPVHSQDSERPRIDGTSILRGFKGFADIKSFRGRLSSLFMKSKKTTGVSLSYTSTWLSGFYYRTSEFEQLHPDLEPSFTLAAEKAIGAPTSQDPEYMKKWNKYLSHHTWSLRNDYLRWKVAFGK